MFLFSTAAIYFVRVLFFCYGSGKLKSPEFTHSEGKYKMFVLNIKIASEKTMVQKLPSESGTQKQSKREKAKKNEKLSAENQAVAKNAE